MAVEKTEIPCPSSRVEDPPACVREANRAHMRRVLTELYRRWVAEDRPVRKGRE